MAALTSLKLSQFRSHTRTELTLDTRPVAIFGPNGAGKTNILEAVSMLSPGRGLRRASVSDLARQPGGIGWKVAGEIDAMGQRHEVETLSEGGPRAVRIDGKAASQIALGRIARVLWLVPAMDRLWIEGAEGRRRFLDRMTLSFDPRHGQAVLDYDKAMRDRNRLLKDQVSDARWYDALEARMAEAGTRIDTARRAALDRVAAAEGGGSFPVATLTLLGPDGAAEPFNPDALATALRDGRPRDMAAGRTLTGPHRADLGAIYTDKGIAAAQCSTGEQKALLISLILSNARALAEDLGAPPLLLLDEVAAHLDAARRAALYDEICALGAQAWMTGTGAELFDDLGDRASHWRVDEDAGSSTVTPA